MNRTFVALAAATALTASAVLAAAFGLRCLNHACDATSKVMNELFGG
jgi:hypothetical protein